MISSQDMTNAIYGAYRLARADIKGMSYFDTSLDGFWRSFMSAAMVAPFFLLLQFIRFDQGSISASLPRFLLIEIIAYVIGWVLFPLVILYLVEALEREKRFIGFVVAYNWAQAIQNFIYLPFAILFVMGVFTGPGAAFFNLILLGLVFVYTWFVAKTALDVSGFVAAGPVTYFLNR